MSNGTARSIVAMKTCVPRLARLALASANHGLPTVL
jgi:hypothetical protein